jgi:hypothetical protein
MTGNAVAGVQTTSSGESIVVIENNHPNISSFWRFSQALIL